MVTHHLAAPLASASPAAPPTPSAYAYPLLLKHLLHAPLATRHTAEIVYRDLRRYDYHALGQRIGRLANALARLGVRPGSTVGVLDWDSHRYLECFLGIPMMGAVLHMVNVRLSAEQILYTINHAEDDVLLVHSDFLPLVEAIRDKLQTVKTLVVLADGAEPATTTTLPFAGEYERLLAASPAEYDFPDFDENTQATTFYTTGTTGPVPKGVSFSHRQLVLHTLATAAAAGTAVASGRVHRGDVYMPITPMFHVHAWGMPYVATMLGLKQVYPGRYDPEVLVRLIQSEGVTFSHCVPTLLHMLLTCPAARDVDLRGLKMVIGGSALPRGLAEAALARGIDIFGGYGMSETCPVLTLSQLGPELLEASQDEQVEVRIKAGRPLPLVDLRTVDPDMRDVARDGSASGEVVVRAPWLTLGYVKDPDSSEALWRGGYLHTGDIGHIDGRGYLKVTDRIKDVIKSGGEWICSLDIESILSQHPAVAEAAVIGIADERWGERPLALVVLKSEATEDELRAHVRAYADRGAISRWAVPVGIRFLDAIDKTSVGKIDKKLLRQKYA
jgi:fatty-acyl-CoA synthase